MFPDDPTILHPGKLAISCAWAHHLAQVNAERRAFRDRLINPPGQRWNTKQTALDVALGKLLMRALVPGALLGGGLVGGYMICLYCNSKVPGHDHCNQCGSPLKVTCNNCGRKVPEGNRCNQCGADLRMRNVPRGICNSCRAPINSQDRFCIVCGTRLTWK